MEGIALRYPGNRSLIGIPVHAGPRRLLETLASLRACTATPFDLVLLPDGPDAETRAALVRLTDLPQLATEVPMGDAACFNRLLAWRTAPVTVLLESGAVVGPGWLERLLGALSAHPSNGLAGPSTNRAWNEQATFPQATDDAAAVAATAQQAARRFGKELRSLAPLHSLGDFCFAVRREVVEAIGAADEGYGLGPCWELDYNARAARAGFLGVWACGAYVHRAPVTARRAREEAARFEASRRHYQDTFCRRRRAPQPPPYDAHCTGDACPDFAVPGLIELHRPLPPASPGSETTPGPRSPAAALQPAGTRIEIAGAPPLVSCIMPTFNRRSFVARAVRCFLAQDYPSLELLVLDDGTDPIADLLPVDPRVHYRRLAGRLTIGAKRNLACAEARGELIAHWDDDDWYPPWRISAQVAPLLDGSAGITGSSSAYFFDAMQRRSWRYSYVGSIRPFVVGSTLAYRRQVWERHRFPELQVGEDARFVAAASAGGVPVRDLADPSLCVASLHPGNTSRKSTRGTFWSQEPVDRVEALLATGPERSPPARQATDLPLASCIMPTRDRRAFLPLTLRCFEAQDYPRRELVVVDDGDEPAADLLQGRPGVVYVRAPGRISIGAKRNLACGAAHGTIMVNWDDDDWYGPSRLREQVAPITSGAADMTALRARWILQLPEGAFWTMSPALHRRMFVGDVTGGTLAFGRNVHDACGPFPDVSLAEDARFLRRALARGRRLVAMDSGAFIYVRHGANTWRFGQDQALGRPGWSRTDPPAGFPAALVEEYQAASASRPGSRAGAPNAQPGEQAYARPGGRLQEEQI